MNRAFKTSEEKVKKLFFSILDKISLEKENLKEDFKTLDVIQIDLDNNIVTDVFIIVKTGFVWTIEANLT